MGLIEVIWGSERGNDFVRGFVVRLIGRDSVGLGFRCIVFSF